MTRKTIIRLIYIVALPILLILSYKVYMHVEYDQQYKSLDNVFKEMNYAAVYSEGLLGYSGLSGVLEASSVFRRDDQIKTLPLRNVSLAKDEGIAVIVGLDDVFVLEFRKKLKDNIFLYITYTYRKHNLLEEVEISNSDTSLAYAMESYCIDKNRDPQRDKIEDLKSTYWFSSTKGLPSLQLTDTKEVLEYLKPYGLDANWIREKSDYMLYDVVLKRWFEKGSQRYSFDNLGDVKIERLEVVK